MATETKNTKAFYNTEIPSDWEVVKVLDFGKVYTGNTPLTSEPDNYDGAFLFVSPGDLSEAKYIEKTEKTLSEKGFATSRKFPKGSVLFTCIGSTIGKSGIATVDLTANQQINAIVVNNMNSNEYLYYQLEMNVNRIKLIAGEQAVPIINKSQFETIKLPKAPLPEQKAIAQVLSTADAAIHTTEKIIAQKVLRKKWLMQQLLSEKRIVKNEKWCNSGVKEVFLKDVAKVTMGQSPNSEDYNTDKDGLPLIQGNADLNERKQVVRYWTSQSNKECDSGDIIMTVRAPVGAIGLATQKSSIGRGVCSIKPKNIDYWYLYHLLVYKEEQWKKLEQGSTFTAVGSKDIFHFPLFIVHSLEEQTAIAKVLQAADKEISLLKAKAEKLREQKKGLMQVLLTGKVRLEINN